jgi:hypothetical protein
MRFQYLLDKIDRVPFSTMPFKHLEIADFFAPEDFAEIVRAPEVALRVFSSDQDLVDGLSEAGYEPIPFPGTTDDVQTYLGWHRGGQSHPVGDTCEGFGMTFRLMRFTSPILLELQQFFTSPAFLERTAARFDITPDATRADSGLQKYLDGYEISPHPDTRQKALTYMVNINPDAESDTKDFHTHYMTFTPSKRYVQEYWRHNPDSERCWVPWDWCETEKRQTRNNSIVLFSPAEDTLHAVRASYDHLTTQRTQFYGNLWYAAEQVRENPQWRDYVITATPVQRVQARRSAALTSSV